MIKEILILKIAGKAKIEEDELPKITNIIGVSKKLRLTPAMGRVTTGVKISTTSGVSTSLPK